MTATIAQPQDSHRRWTVSRNSIGWSVFLFAAFLITLSGWIPWRVEYPNETLDTSWMLALKWAQLHKVDFGTSFVFTYGPWGYALQGYEPATFSTMVAVWAFFAAAFFFALIVLCQNSAQPWWAGAIWTTAVVMLFSSNITQDVRMLSLSWMLLLVHFTAKGRTAEICKVVLVIAMALAGLVKFTMTLMAVATIALIAVQQIVEIFSTDSNRRKSARIFMALRNPVIFFVAYLALWLMAGQRISSLPAYVSHSMEISSSYDRTQQLVSTDEFSTISFFLMCAVPFLTLILLAFRRQRLAGVFAILGVGLCIFLIFKEGYVRHDGHELHATAGLLLLALLWSFALWRSWNWISKSMAIAVIVGSSILCWRTFSKYDGAGLPREMGRVFWQFPARSRTALSWLAGHCNMQPSYDAEIQALSTDSAGVPDVKGTADIYPWNSAMLIARNQDYDPRPVMQSYLVSTPALSELNASFLRSTQAPDWMYFDFATIDSRYPSMDDALSWPELLTRYNLRDLNADSTVYERSQYPRSYQIIPDADQTAMLGDDIAVPATDDFIWARIDVRQTVVGKVKEEVFKATPIEMRVETADGMGETFRVLPDVARAGFLLSPRVRDRNEFATLYSKDWKTQLADQMVTHIRVESTGKSGIRASYEPTVHFSFDRLQFPRRDLSGIPGFSSYIGLRYLIHHSWMLDAEAPSGLVRVNDHQFGFAVIGKSQVMVVPPAPPTSVHVGFGMLDSSYQSDPKTSGVMFLVFSMKADGTAVPLWGKLLHPETVEKDRGYQTADVPLPAGTSKIVLETGPVVDGPVNACYWGEVEFR